MDQTDVLIIGGSAAGIVAATTAKSFHPEKKVTLVRKEENVLVPCGMPYIFGTLESSDQDQIPDSILLNAGIALKIVEVDSIDTEEKVCKIKGNADIRFEKLILATGSTPIRPKWLKGAELENVSTIPKDKIYLDHFKASLSEVENVIIVGGGFIGIEMADELNKSGKKVTVVEMMPHVLSMAFDDELALELEKELRSRGIRLKTGVSVREINGEKNKAVGVTLENGEKLPAEAVILSVGYRPNSALAEKAGLPTNKMGFIQVNEYMKTEHPDIFAVGDCAAKSSFITRSPKPTMLASTSCAEARIAAMSLYKLSTVRLFGGTISIFCTAIGDLAFGAAGVTENLATEREFDILTGTFQGTDQHPGTLPGTQKQTVKLIVAKESGIVLGGEVIGGKSTGELTNLIGFIIQNRMSVDALLTAQIGTHPLLTGPPIAYPLIKAAELVARQQRLS
ncbi:FAD-dependent pyridine nucleotide-disulphide oxidoreductase [uncultured Desulfatiglans sp.]|nr:FAD-dependent pyridine nucleotide-disulphide oxidoreductase [uncultured Desulfatiglans sp.]